MNHDDPPPQPPEPPAPGDCCHSGCAYCVDDLYQDELERYRAALRAWQTRHPAAQPGCQPGGQPGCQV